jgi:hypothetical protein
MNPFRLFSRRRADRPAARGPLVVINLNFFFGLGAPILRGLLRRQAPALEPPRRPRSMPSSFVGGGRSRALSELDACIPNEPRGFDRRAGPVINEAEPAPPVRILLGRPGRER